MKKLIGSVVSVGIIVGVAYFAGNTWNGIALNLTQRPVGGKGTDGSPATQLAPLESINPGDLLGAWEVFLGPDRRGTETLVFREGGKLTISANRTVTVDYAVNGATIRIEKDGAEGDWGTVLAIDAERFTIRFQDCRVVEYARMIREGE